MLYSINWQGSGPLEIRWLDLNINKLNRWVLLLTAGRGWGENLFGVYSTCPSVAAGPVLAKILVRAK